MDFNDIQNAWNSEKTDNVVLPDNLEKINSANTPLDKIKRNLRNDLIAQTVAVVLIGASPYMHGFPEKWIVPFYLLFSIFFAVSIYYLIKLYLFYRRLNNITLKTRDSLYETYFDIRLNMELYKTFGFALTPFLVLFLIGVLYHKYSMKPGGFQLTDFSNGQLTSVFVIVVFCILFMGLSVEWTVKRFYGKYAKEIKKLIDELREE
ncbi:hypothetical protein [Flavobacterium denitrificans]|uniref:hypothetical protein n=1 Tax=Flavobacterium denitrificans TaxID=281361 RepID=UPI000425CA77|nr:hypothetical protein [Flavobacterium denitrificans]